MNAPVNKLETPSQAAIDLAKQVGESMFAVDTASKDTMGMQLMSCEPGRAVIQMTVKEMHLNGHKICQPLPATVTTRWLWLQAAALNF
ncbi:MAG: Acyl-coenzyme thioesterase PaaI [Pseudomonadota bacterium]